MGPDGLEERTAYYAECTERDLEQLEIDEAEQEMDEGPYGGYICDCCDERPATHKAWVFGNLETLVCDECGSGA